MNALARIEEMETALTPLGTEMVGALGVEAQVAYGELTLIAERERIVEVVRPIETRVGAPVAATCYVDNSPPPVVREIAPGIKAVRGEGRPSKRLRRELERMRRAGPG